MRGAGDQLSIGERVAFYRARRGLTQGQVAAMVSRSEDWLSKIERGDRDLRKLDMIVALAAALRVTVGSRWGHAVLREEEDGPRGHDIPAVRDALMTPRRLYRLLYAGTVSPEVNVQHMAVFAEQGWSDFQRGRVGKVVAVLPDLIGSAQALEDQASGSGTQGWSVSARIHHLAATTLAKIGEGDLAWLAAERAMFAADQSDDPLVLASATRAGTHALLSAGRYEEAMQLGSTAAQFLLEQMDADDPAAQSLLGMLYLRASCAAARHDDRASVTELLDRRTRRLNGSASTRTSGRPRSDLPTWPCTGSRTHSSWETSGTSSSTPHRLPSRTCPRSAPCRTGSTWRARRRCWRTMRTLSRRCCRPRPRRPSSCATAQVLARRSRRCDVGLRSRAGRSRRRCSDWPSVVGRCDGGRRGRCVCCGWS